MATAEEVLQTMAEVPESAPVCVIDPETRTIIVPPEYQLFGVENDKRTERLYFQCPKIVGDNQDLSRDYQLFINYQNANGEPDAYHIEDMEVDGDNITFSWLLEENVTKYRGNIQFAFGAIIPGDEAEDPDKNRWNTTINTDCTCLIGLKCTQQVAESNPDALVQIWAAIDELKAGGGGGTGGTTNYNNLSNKPQLNGVTLEGNKTLDQVGVLAKNQGSSNSGKFLSVGSDGNVVPADAPSGGTVNPEQIKQAVIDNIRPLVVNLVSCLKNVAWVKQNGQDYVNDLIDSFCGTSEGNTNKKWTYISSYNKKLSEYDYLSASISDAATEEIKDAFLHLFIPKGTDGNNLIRYDLKDEVTNDAKLTARVRFNSIPITSAGSGFRLQLSNGISGVQIFQYHNHNDILNFLVYEGSRHIIKNEIKLKKWYEISVELSAGYQVVSIDGAEILRSNVLSTNYCNKNSIILQNAVVLNQVDSDVDIEWISYESAEA